MRWLIIPALILLALGACESDQHKLDRLRQNVAKAQYDYQFWYDSARRVRRREGDLREATPPAMRSADSLDSIARTIDTRADSAKDRESLAQRDLDRFLK